MSIKLLMTGAWTGPYADDSYKLWIHPLVDKFIRLQDRLYPNGQWRFVQTDDAILMDERYDTSSAPDLQELPVVNLHHLGLVTDNDGFDFEIYLLLDQPDHTYLPNNHLTHYTNAWLVEDVPECDDLLQKSILNILKNFKRPALLETVA